MKVTFLFAHNYKGEAYIEENANSFLLRTILNTDAFKDGFSQKGAGAGPLEPLHVGPYTEPGTGCRAGLPPSAGTPCARGPAFVAHRRCAPGLDRRVARGSQDMRVHRKRPLDHAVWLRGQLVWRDLPVAPGGRHGLRCHRVA
ncbi:hypothetical protein D3C72_1549520 [compost metagenome]